MSDEDRKAVSPVGTRAVDAAWHRARRSEKYREARDEYAAIPDLRNKDSDAADFRKRRYELGLDPRSQSQC